MLPVEISLNNRGPSLATPPVAPNISDQLSFIPCSAPAEGVALDVLILKFGGIRLRAVAWQKKQADGLLSFFDPIKNNSRTMYRLYTKDQEYRAFILSDQTVHGINKQLGVETSSENHKVQISQVGNHRNHIAFKTLNRNLGDWSLTFNSPSAAHGADAAQPNSINPLNSGSSHLVLLHDGWILVLRPVLNLYPLLLVCSTHRLLRTKTPANQISADRTQCQGHTEFSFNERTYSLVSLEGKRQAQLAKIVAANQSDNPDCLKTLKFTAASRPTLEFGLETLFPVLLVSFQPFLDNDSEHTKEFDNLDTCVSPFRTA